MDTAAAMARVAELEAQRDAVNAEIDAVIAEMPQLDGDSFLERLVVKAMRERDNARQELVALKAKLAVVDNELEIDRNRWKLKAQRYETAVHAIVNDPLSKREDVQSRLLLCIQNIDKEFAGR